MNCELQIILLRGLRWYLLFAYMLICILKLLFFILQRWNLLRMLRSTKLVTSLWKVVVVVHSWVHYLAIYTVGIDTANILFVYLLWYSLKFLFIIYFIIISPSLWSRVSHHLLCLSSPNIFFLFHPYYYWWRTIFVLMIYLIHIKVSTFILHHRKWRSFKLFEHLLILSLTYMWI